MLRIFVVSYRRSGRNCGLHLQESISPGPLKVGLLNCPETWVINYQHTLRNITEEPRSHLHRGGSLKSLTVKPVLSGKHLQHRESKLQVMYQMEPSYTGKHSVPYRSAIRKFYSVGLNIHKYAQGHKYFNSSCIFP
jgi:hypothetical protein